MSGSNDAAGGGPQFLSVSQMARECGFSRSHWYALVAREVMPRPCYGRQSKKPHYTADQQRLCLHLVRHNLALDGQVYLYYARRKSRLSSRPHSESPKKRGPQRMDAVDVDPTEEVLRVMIRLGLNVTREQVQTALQELFPQGLADADGEAIRKIFCHLRRQNPA